MTWASIITVGLRMLISVFEYLKSRQLIQAGEDKIIAASVLELLEVTEEGKRLREYVRTLGEADENDLWSRMIK